MLMCHIPAEAKDPAQPSISAILGCDPRTVRNRRDSAVKNIRRHLGIGDVS